MLEILLKAASYIAVIILGFVLRRVGFFDEHEFPVLSKLVIKVTLPAALISSAVGREIDLSLLTTVLLEVPFLAGAFGFVPVGLTEYAIALGLGFLVIPIVEGVKFFQRRMAK